MNMQTKHSDTIQQFCNGKSYRNFGKLDERAVYHDSMEFQFAVYRYFTIGWILTVLTICSRLTIPLAHAGGDNSDLPKVIHINGPISFKAYSKLSSDLRGFHNSDPIPAGLIVFLDSPGGAGEAAIELGRLLRKIMRIFL